MEFEEKPSNGRRFIRDRFLKWFRPGRAARSGKGQAQRDLIFHNGAVAVIALTPENKLILKQYRKAIEATSYEICAGKL